LGKLTLSRHFAAGILLLLFDLSGNTISTAQALGPAVGCGGVSGMLNFKSYTIVD